MSRVAFCRAGGTAAMIVRQLGRSELGQKRRFSDVRVTSALPLNADIHREGRHVRFLHNRRHRRLTKHGRGRQLRRPLYQLLRPVFAAVSWGAVLNVPGFRPTIHCAGPYRACTSRHRSGISPLGFSVLQGSKKWQSNYTSDRNQSPHDSPPDSGKLRIAPQRIKFPEIRTLLNSVRTVGVKYG